VGEEETFANRAAATAAPIPTDSSGLRIFEGGVESVAVRVDSTLGILVPPPTTSTYLSTSTVERI